MLLAEQQRHALPADPMPPVAAALLLAASLLLAAMFVMFASGMFPRPARPARLRGALGSGLIWAGTALSMALVLVSVRSAWSLLAWPYVVIAAGLGALAGPLAYQAMPAPCGDTPLGAALICALAGALLGTWLAAPG